MPVTIQPVTTPQEHRTFADFIWEHYANDPHWVAPLVSQRYDVLDKRKNPAWDYMEGEYFLARRDGRAVGTIAAFINHRHNDYHKERVGWFGMFECIDDQETADALLNTAKGAWLRHHTRTAKLYHARRMWLARQKFAHLPATDGRHALQPALLSAIN